MTLLDDFITASKEIAVDLEMNENDVMIEHEEIPNIGLDYKAFSRNKAKEFNFSLWTDATEEDPTTGVMTATLSISFEVGAPYYYSQKINFLKTHSDFLSRWVAWAIHNYRLQYEKVNLTALFREIDMHVYSIPGYSSTTDREAVLLFNGILATQKDKVIIYKFRHVPPDYYLRNFSYAVHVHPIKYQDFIVFFPFNCGLDSGGSRSTYRHFKSLIEMINEKIDVEIIRYDIQYNELEKYLLKNAIGFPSLYNEYTLTPLWHISGPAKVLKGSEISFKNFKNRLEEKKYPQALRDLRALVQQALENVINYFNLDGASLNNINQLSSFLINKQLLDGRLLSWFNAFTSIANIASHKDYPTKNDMSNYVLQERIILTFYLGLHLLKELDRLVES